MRVWVHFVCFFNMFSTEFRVIVCTKGVLNNPNFPRKFVNIGDNSINYLVTTLQKKWKSFFWATSVRHNQLLNLTKNKKVGACHTGTIRNRAERRFPSISRRVVTNKCFCCDFVVFWSWALSTVFTRCSMFKHSWTVFEKKLRSPRDSVLWRI